MKFFNFLLIISFFLLINNLESAEKNRLSASITNNSNVKAAVAMVHYNPDTPLKSEKVMFIKPGETKKYNSEQFECVDGEFGFGVLLPEIKTNKYPVSVEVKPTNNQCKDKHKIVINGSKPNEYAASVDDESAVQFK